MLKFLPGTLFRTFCELNNCTQMSKVDVLSYRQVDKQTIEHTDTLQSFTAYVYTFVTEDVKITKEIVTSQRGNSNCYFIIIFR